MTVLYRILRYAFRMHGRTPVFTAVSVASLALGIGGNAAMFRFLTSLLYGVGETDALTFVLVTSLVLGVAVLATAYSAWRATRIDPINSLRAE